MLATSGPELTTSLALNTGLAQNVTTRSACAPDAGDAATITSQHHGTSQDSHRSSQGTLLSPRRVAEDLLEVGGDVVGPAAPDFDDRVPLSRGSRLG